MKGAAGETPLNASPPAASLSGPALFMHIEMYCVQLQACLQIIPKKKHPYERGAQS